VKPTFKRNFGEPTQLRGETDRRVNERENWTVSTGQRQKIKKTSGKEDLQTHLRIGKCLRPTTREEDTCESESRSADLQLGKASAKAKKGRMVGGKECPPKRKPAGGIPLSRKNRHFNRKGILREPTFSSKRGGRYATGQRRQRRIPTKRASFLICKIVIPKKKRGGPSGGGI